MKLVCFLAVALALCAGAQATKSFDLVKGSPVSVSVVFEPLQGTIVTTLMPIVVPGRRSLRRNLLDIIIPANMSSIPGADELLPLLTGASEDSVQDSNSTSEDAAQDVTVAGRHLLSGNPVDNPTPLKPHKFELPFSVKKSALSSFVTIAVDFSGVDAMEVLKFYREFQGEPRSSSGPVSSLVNAQILVFPEVVEGPEIVEIVESDFCLGSDGKGRTETFGFRGDVNTFQAFTAWGTREQPKTGARIYIAFEIQTVTTVMIKDKLTEVTTYSLFIIPATDFKVEKASLPTIHGLVDTLCA